MFLLLNRDNVIIDIVENVRYVCRNKNGLIIGTHNQAEAEAYIGSDNATRYPKAGAQIVPTYYDIAREQAVNELAEEVEPLKYKWDPETQDVTENTDAYPLDNTTLATQADQNAANIEYLAMVTGTDL